MEEIVSKSQIEINIHRGANQIGGCITEIATAQSRIILIWEATCLEVKQRN